MSYIEQSKSPGTTVPSIERSLVDTVNATGLNGGYGEYYGTVSVDAMDTNGFLLPPTLTLQLMSMSIYIVQVNMY